MRRALITTKGWRYAQTSQSATAFFKAVGQAEDNAENSSDGEQLYIRALIAGAENDQAAQLEAISSLLGMYPKDERTHVALANYHFGQQNFADAIKHFEHATSINPNFAAAFNSLGYAHRSNDDLDGAKAAFPYDSYAELLMEMGEYDESIANYRKASEIDAHFPSAYAGVSINESLKGNAEASQAAAAEMLAAARNNGEKQAAMFRSVVSHLFAGNIDAAIAVSEERYAMAEADGNQITRPWAAFVNTWATSCCPRETAAKRRSTTIVRLVTGKWPRLTMPPRHRQSGPTSSRPRSLRWLRAISRRRQRESQSTPGRQKRTARRSSGAGFMKLNEDFETAAAEFAAANQLEPIVLYWAAVANRNLGNTEQAVDLANRAAYRNTLSPNLPFFRDEALALLEELEAE
jgi:tetratricopeptide (TPR) repeat protein